MSTGEFLLKVENLSKSFMGVKAVDSLSFEVPYNMVFGLIGPNGAGKSTVFNLISKLYEPDQGNVQLKDTDLTPLKPHQVNQSGIARTFQNIRLLNQLSVLDNVLVALGTKSDYSMLDVILNRKRFREEEEKQLAAANELLKKSVGLYERRSDRADSLPYGQQRQLEIVRAMATKPKLLLMDEPAAGMNGTEKEQLKEYINIVLKEGITVLLIEHDMSFVMDICEKIVVLNFGKKIAEGSPEEIQSNENVIEAYLGRRESC